MSIRKQVFILLIILMCCCSAFAQQQQTWSLRRAIEYALANNISVKQADIQGRLTNLTFKQNRLQQIPNLSGSASGGYNFGRSIDPTTNQFTTTQLFNSGFSLSSAVTVFNFFSLKNTIAGSRLDNEASAANVERIRNDVALNVATGFLQILVAREQANIAKVAVQQTLQNLNNTQKRVDAGALPELNTAELEAQLALDSSNLFAADNTVRQNILLLKAILNLDAGVDFAIESPPLDKIPVLPLGELQPEYVYKMAVENLPQQKVNELRILAAQKYVKAAKGQLYPTLAAFGGLGSNYANNKVPTVLQVPTNDFTATGAKVDVGGTLYDVLAPGYNTIITANKIPFNTQISDNFRQNIGLQLNVPIFNNGVARTALERSKLNVSSLQLQRDLDLQTLKQDIYTAYNDAATSLQRFGAGKKSVVTAEKAYNFAQKRYELGLLTTIDLLTNQNNLNRARVELAQAQVDYVFRLKLLEFYKGQGIKVE
jgi:outer membrane protein